MYTPLRAAMFGNVKISAQATGLALLASFSMPLGLLGVSSCAGDGCELYPNDARCTAMPEADITLLTTRVAKSGGRLDIKVKNLMSTDHVTLDLGVGAPIAFMVSGDGNGAAYADIPEDRLSTLPPGPRKVTIQAGDKKLTKEVHIYVPASFTDNTKIVKSTTPRNPAWVQIYQQQIYAADESAAAMNTKIEVFRISGNAFQPGTSPDPLSGLQPSLNLLLDVASNTTVQLRPTGGQNYSLEYTLLTSQTGTYTNLRMLTYTLTSALAMDRAATVVAVAGAGVDGPLKAFTVPPMGQDATPISITGMPSGKQPRLLAWGFLDDYESTNRLVDLLVVHTDNTFAVYLQKTANNLTYDQNLSKALQTPADLAADMAMAMTVVDLDRDGMDDVIFGQSSQVVQLTNEGNGTFSRRPLLNGIAADTLTVGELDNQNGPELLLAQKAGAALIVYPNLSP